MRCIKEIRSKDLGWDQIVKDLELSVEEQRLYSPVSEAPSLKMGLWGDSEVEAGTEDW